MIRVQHWDDIENSATADSQRRPLCYVSVGVLTVQCLVTREEHVPNDETIAMEKDWAAGVRVWTTARQTSLRPAYLPYTALARPAISLQCGSDDHLPSTLQARSFWGSKHDDGESYSERRTSLLPGRATTEGETSLAMQPIGILSQVKPVEIMPVAVVLSLEEWLTT